MVCGGVGTAFYHAVALATRLRKAHPWLLYLLPAAGLLTAYLYALLKMEKDPGTAISRLLKLSDGETRLVTMCGMSAVFAAVFGTPLTAAVFSIEVASVGMISSTAVLPCVLSSMTAAYIARLLGAEAEAYVLQGVPALSLQSL